MIRSTRAAICSATFVLSAATLLVSGCSASEGRPSGENQTGGTSATGSGGSVAQGGTTGTGASTGSGATTGAGATTAVGGTVGSGGTPNIGVGGTSGGGTSGGGTSGGGTSSGGTAGTTGDPCSAAGLVWKTARKTWYTSYPEPGSEECEDYSGCQWAGWFAACTDQKSEDWVAAHNIAAAFPDFDSLELHDLCIKSGDKTMIVTVYDTCGDEDCSGCCTTNQGANDALIDLESHTNARWGLPDGVIQWADLGPTTGDGCN